MPRWGGQGEKEEYCNLHMQNNEMDPYPQKLTQTELKI